MYKICNITCITLIRLYIFDILFNFSPTLRTVVFFGDRSSTRFCDSIPDVFCWKRIREGVGCGYAQLASLVKGTEGLDSGVDSSGHKSATNTAKEGTFVS